MTSLSSTFATLIRSTLRLFCARCGKETAHRLAREGQTTETYSCLKCGATQTFTVR